MIDPFKVFDLPQCFTIDENDLKRRYRALRTQVHPDRVARYGKNIRDVPHNNLRFGSPSTYSNPMLDAATAMSEDVNEAYNILQDPLRRAACILALRGQDPFDESANIQMPTDFLERQMELREQLEELEEQADNKAIQNMMTELQEEIDQEFVSLGANLDASEPDDAAAIAGVLRLRYLINCRKEAARLAGRLS